MAKTVKKDAERKKDPASDSKRFKITKQHRVLAGSLLVLFAIALLLAFASFFIYGAEDQSAVGQLTDRSIHVKNWLGKFGDWLADIFVF